MYASIFRLRFFDILNCVQNSFQKLGIYVTGCKKGLVLRIILFKYQIFFFLFLYMYFKFGYVNSRDYKDKSYEHSQQFFKLVDIHKFNF
jgi:hypothetical protein